MIKKTALFFFVLVSYIVHSTTIEKGWSCFEGSIGKSDVVVNIYCDSIGNLTGDYCYQKYDIRIPLKGKLNGSVIFLDEFTNNKITAKFNGKIDEKKNTIGGKWSSTTHSDIPFLLKLSSSRPGSFESKYGMGIEDTEVELFLKKAKQAIVIDDKTWLSKNIKFPLTLYANGKAKLKVKNAKDFIKNYKLIITPSYKQTIKDACACNIFSNWQGAMIANGFLWINETDDYQLKIIAINN